MDLSQLKSQITTIFMMKQPANGQQQDILVLIYGILMMSAMEVFFRHLPTIGAWIQTHATQLIKRKGQELLPAVVAAAADTTSSVTLVRTYASGNNGTQRTYPAPESNPYTERVDAVIQFMCSLDATRHVRIESRCTLNTRDEVQLTPLIKARVQQGGSTDGDTVTITIYSSQLRVSQLQAWIDEVYEGYLYEKANKLGNRTFYFNEVATEPMRQLDARTKEEVIRVDNAPVQLSFTMNEFRTAKSFANVFGDHVTELRERLDLFLNHPEWYMDRGIPHCLGVMLHGIPGAGKTSTIKAIAHDTKRHIFNLSLRPWTTQKQLMNLFFNETVTVTVPGQNQPQTYKIPLNRRVYVIEDIDCLTDVVLDREWQQPEFEVTAEGVPVPKKKLAVTGDTVTLSFLLNLLDGVLETPGRILVITTNYPERLDRALIRPGRIDVRIGFGHANRALIRDMVQKFYTLEPAIRLEDIPEELENRFTPAEVMEALCTHFKDHRAAISHLLQHCAKPVLIQDVIDTIQHDTMNITLMHTTALEERVDVLQKARSVGQENRACDDDIQESQLDVADSTSILTKSVLKHNARFPDYAQFTSMYNDTGNDGLASLDAAFAAPTFTRLQES